MTRARLASERGGTVPVREVELDLDNDEITPLRDMFKRWSDPRQAGRIGRR
jgi:hypothetical protein